MEWVFSVCNGSMLIWYRCFICGCWGASVVEAWISSSKHIFLPPKYVGKNRQHCQPSDPAVCPVFGTSTGLCTQLVPQLRFRSTCSVVALFCTFATCTRWCEMKNPHGWVMPHADIFGPSKVFVTYFPMIDNSSNWSYVYMTSFFGFGSLECNLLHSTTRRLAVEIWWTW